MRTIELIDKEIKELKEKMLSVKGTETEVYTRIVGYYRAVKNWNKGKRDEYHQRKLFTQPEKESFIETETEVVKTSSGTPTPKIKSVELKQETSELASYIYFYRSTCPNCPPVKKWLEDFHLTGEEVNVDEGEGFKKASTFQIFSSPTVVFTNKDGEEQFRATNTNMLEELFAKATA